MIAKKASGVWAEDLRPCGYCGEPGFLQAMQRVNRIEYYFMMPLDQWHKMMETSLLVHRECEKPTRSFLLNV